MVILEPFYEIRNILDMCVTSSMFFHIHHQAFYLLCLNINKRLSLRLKFIPVNFGFSKIHPHWGPTLYYWINYSGDTIIRDTRLLGKKKEKEKKPYLPTTLFKTMLLETNNFLRPNQYVVGITLPKKSNLSLKLKDVTRDSITVELLFFSRGSIFHDF